MNQHRLLNIEDLIEVSLNPRALRARWCLPHPLSKFAANGAIQEGPYADGILELVHDLAYAAPGSNRHRVATWFIYESEYAFFVVCSEARIDAWKLRTHLERFQRGERD
jgi:hypothetical protein